jgi:hypothetical protein
MSISTGRPAGEARRGKGGDAGDLAAVEALPAHDLLLGEARRVDAGGAYGRVHACEPPSAGDSVPSWLGPLAAVERIGEQRQPGWNRTAVTLPSGSAGDGSSWNAVPSKKQEIRAALDLGRTASSLPSALTLALAMSPLMCRVICVIRPSASA